MKPQLKDVLAKDASALSAEEKSVLHENWDLLNADFLAKFADVAPTTEKAGAIDEATLKSLISEETRKGIDEKAEALANQLVKSFYSKLDSARQAVHSDPSAAKANTKENNEIMRKYMRGLATGDVALMEEALGTKAIDTTQDGSGADAGFTIPTVLANEVIRLQSVGYGLARQIFAYNLLTQGNSKRVTALGSALSVYWTDEGGKKKSSQPGFKIVTLTLKKLAVIVPWTDEVAEDTGIDLVNLIAQLIREAVDKEVDIQFFNGDGTVWTGIFNDTTIPTTELANNVTIAGMRPEDIIGLADDTPLGVNGAYLMHRTVLSKIRTLRENADGTGNYIYNVLGGPGGGTNNVFAPGTLNGYPVILSEAAPTASSAAVDGNKPIMMFGDYSRGVAYGEKSDVKLKLLDQATITDTDGETQINLAEQDMQALRAVQRVGMKVVLPTAMRRLVTGD